MSYFGTTTDWAEMNRIVCEQEERERKSRRISCLLSMIDSRKQALCMCRDAEIRNNIRSQIEGLEKEIQEVRNS